MEAGSILVHSVTTDKNKIYLGLTNILKSSDLVCLSSVCLWGSPHLELNSIFFSNFREAYLNFILQFFFIWLPVVTHLYLSTEIRIIF